MSGGTRSYEMAKRWAALGHEVHIVTSSGKLSNEHKHWSMTEVDGVKIHWCNVPYGNEMSSRSRIVAFLKFAVLAGPRARRLGGEVIFATSTPLTIILPALYAKMARRTPIVFEVRDLWPEMPIAVGALRNPVAKCLARLLERLAYSQSSKIVALSDGMAEGVEKCGVDRNKIVVAPNSCDIKRFDVPPEAGLEYRALHPWLGSRDFVVYCGTLGKINGVSYLVRLAAEMKRRGHDTVFGVYGSGKETVEVEDLASKLGVLNENFFMMGELAKERIPEILSASTLCTSVFVPIKEMEVNSANKFFDALAARRPVAINYGGWQAELIQRNQIGILLDPFNITDAAATLIKFLNLPNAEKSNVGETAGRIGRERFARDRISQSVLDEIVAAGASQLSSRAG
jgi:glycosyltransferase involved in cell wall biosynthesis